MTISSKKRQNQRNICILTLVQMTFINGKIRYCLWLKNAKFEEFNQINEIKKRVEKVREFRLASRKIPTKKKANIPHCFTEDRYVEDDFIIVPMVSSEKREYVPIGFCDRNVIASNLASFISGARPEVFGIITSKMSMSWVRTVGGKLRRKRLRFSASTVYNTFPFPPISDQRKQENYPMRIPYFSGTRKTLRQNSGTTVRPR